MSGVLQKLQKQLCVTVTDCITGCSVEDCIVIEQDTTPPIVDLMQNGPLTCSQTSVEISTIAGYSYLWSTAETSNPITVTTAGTYCVTVTNPSNGCMVTDCILVEQDTIVPVVNLVQDGPLTCDKTSVVISTSAGYCYTWSTGDQTETITVTAPGNYCVTVTDCVGGCMVADCILVEQDTTLPIINLVQSDSLSCESPSIQVSTPIHNGHTYLWHTGDTTNTITIDTPTICIVTVTNQFTGCSTTDSIEIVGTTDCDTIPEPPTISCVQNANGTALVWEDSSMTNQYNIIIQEGDGGCCPSEPDAMPPTTIEVVDDSMFVVPNDFPECYTYQLQIIDENGDTTLSSPMCMNDSTMCDSLPVDPDSCQLDPPGGIICRGNTLIWSPVAGAIAYTVTISYGDSPCCEEIVISPVQKCHPSILAKLRIYQ